MNKDIFYKFENSQCNTCEKYTKQKRLKYIFHILLSFVLPFWLLVWAILTTKKTCIECNNVVKTNEHYKTLWVLTPLIIVISSYGASMGSVADYENSATFLNMQITQEQLDKRAISSFYNNLFTKSFIFAVFGIIALILNKLKSVKLTEMKILTISMTTFILFSKILELFLLQFLKNI